MPINPNTHALPAYILLQGLTRLVALFFVALACGIFASDIVVELFRYSNRAALLDSLTNVYTWSPLAGMLPIAALLWFNSTRIARWCTPKIDLRRCQVCGYHLPKDQCAPCPECGYQPHPQTKHPQPSAMVLAKRGPCSERSSKKGGMQETKPPAWSSLHASGHTLYPDLV